MKAAQPWVSAARQDGKAQRAVTRGGDGPFSRPINRSLLLPAPLDRPDRKLCEHVELGVTLGKRWTPTARPSIRRSQSVTGSARRRPQISPSSESLPAPVNIKARNGIRKSSAGSLLAQDFDAPAKNCCAAVSMDQGS